MKLKVFYIEYLVEMLLLSRALHYPWLPLPFFFVLITALLVVKYVIEGFVPHVLLLILCFLASALAENCDQVILWHSFSILGGLLYFIPLKLYWLPDHRHPVGFREEQLDGKLHYFEFFPLQAQNVTLKSLKWARGKEMQMYFASKNITNKLVEHICRVLMSHNERYQLKVGEGVQKPASAGIAFSHGKGATPLFYSSKMMHFAGQDYKVGAVQHNEVSYLRWNQRAKIKAFREIEVEDRARELIKVIEKLNCQKIVLMGHSYGCSTSLQAYFMMPEAMRAKVSHIILLDPWFFPLKEPELNQKIPIPILLVANQDFVRFQSIYLANKQFYSKTELQYVILKNAHHLHHSDVGFLAGNLPDIIKNHHLSQQLMELNFYIIERFLKGERVEGTLGDKDLGRYYSPKEYNKENMMDW